MDKPKSFPRIRYCRSCIPFEGDDPPYPPHLHFWTDAENRSRCLFTRREARSYVRGMLRNIPSRIGRFIARSWWIPKKDNRLREDPILYRIVVRIRNLERMWLTSI